MHSHVITFRRFLAASAVLLGLLTVSSRGRAGETRQLVVQNTALRLCLTLGPQGISERMFENRLSGERISLPPEEFLLEFDDGAKLSSRGLNPKVQAAAADRLDLLFSDPSGLEVRVEHWLAPQAHYTQKRITVRQASGPARRLVRVELENWQGVTRPWTTLQADRVPYGSHPVFCDTLWAGVEFVAAFNQVGPGGFTLCSRPGRRLIGPAWLELRGTAIGVAPPGGVYEAFLRYIDDVRLSPPRIQACYNSWWTLPKVVKQQANLALIQQLKAAMFDRHRIFFDIITTDMGWSNPRSIWEIDRSILPRGFDDIRSIVEPAGGRLGLWMSPSEIYPPVCDYDWAEKAGYTVLRPEREKATGHAPTVRIPGLSLADPKYREETKRQLQRLIRENGLGHIKYDGFWAIEWIPHHDLPAGEDSIEPLAEYSLELLQASKQANPQLVTEPTYMNSIVNYISPWILKYSDTVWANGEDCVVGIGPAPDYRESHTNAREFIIFQALDQVWLPQNAVHYFDIIHVDEREAFPNHAAMAFGRGRFFLSTYVNPKLMNDDDWRIYAGLLRWARGNAGLLRQTKILPSRVELGEPYAYAHWSGQRGIIAVRNPSNANQEYVLELAKAGAPGSLADAVCYTQYPYRRGIATGVNHDARVTLQLAPWEMLFVEVVPRGQLQEAVAIGARWYRGQDGAMSVAPDHGVEKVRLLEPGKGERTLAVQPRRDEPLSSIGSHSIRPVDKAGWLAAAPKTAPPFPFRYPADFNAETLSRIRKIERKNVPAKEVPTVVFDVVCGLSIPAEATSAKVLLLVEFPGRSQQPSRCTAWVDGREVPTEQRSSAEHIGYYNWTGRLRDYESEWTWYLVDVTPGSHRVRFEGKAGQANSRIGLWAWADRDLGKHLQPALIHCSEPTMPQYRDRLVRQGLCLLPPTAAAISPKK